MTRPTRTDLNGARRGLSVTELRRLFRLAAPQAWAAPLLVALGFAASLAETLGITFVVVFLYVAMGRGSEAPATGGLLDPLFAAVRTHLGDGSSVAIAGLVFVLITAKAALGFAYTLVSARVRNRLGEVVRNGLHRRFLESPYAEIRRHDQGDLLNLLATSSWSIAERLHVGHARADQPLLDRGLRRLPTRPVLAADCGGRGRRNGTVPGAAPPLRPRPPPRRSREGGEPEPGFAHAGRPAGHADHPRLRAGAALPGSVRARLRASPVPPVWRSSDCTH